MRPHNADDARQHYLALTNPESRPSYSPSTREFFVQHVRDALNHFRNRAYLQSHPLSRLAAKASRLGDQPPPNALELALRGCIQDRDLWGGRKALLLQQLLLLRYVEGLEVRDVQTRLGVSRSEYFREQQRAIEVLSDRLWSVWSLDDQPEPTHLALIPSASAQRALEPPNNLPLPPTRLIGREREMAELRGLLEGSRLLTLTGAGGSGKTRLALELAWFALDEFGLFPDGVFLVDLSPLRDAAMVIPAIARVLGVHQIGRQPLAKTIERHLTSRALLLVLDNFEHLLGASSQIADLLSTCSRLKVIATSREPLHLRVEQEYLVPPLGLPDLKHLPPADSLSSCPAIGLFVEAVQRVKPDFALGEPNASAVAELCVRLDGLPLALELAAARGGALSPIAILQRLEGRLDLPGVGPRDLPARQQTIRATLDWSYALLTEGERRLFRRLSVFVGGFTVDAAESVGEGRADGDSDAGNLGTLIGLVEKNMVAQAMQEASGQLGIVEPHYRQLETLREYASDQLATGGEVEQARRRHAEYCLGFADRAGAELFGPQQALWFERLEREYDNLQTAAYWWIEQGEVDTAARICGVLWELWWRRCRWSDGLHVLEQVLARSKQASLSTRGRALHAMGFLLDNLGEHKRAQAILEESVSLLRIADDRTALARSLVSLALSAWIVGDSVRAAAMADEVLVLARASSDLQNTVYALRVGALAAYSRGDPDRAAALIEAGIASSPDPANRAYCRLVQSVIVCDRDPETSIEAAREALRINRRLGDKWGVLHALVGIAYGALLKGPGDLAVRLASVVSTIAEQIGAQVPAFDRTRFDASLARLRQDVGEDVFVREWAEGQEMSLDEAAEFALRVLETQARRRQVVAEQPSERRRMPSDRPGWPEGLTAREVEVLRLLASGRSNREIAAALILSVSTVDRHIANIYSKVDVHGRAEAATYAVRHGLMEAI